MAKQLSRSMEREFSESRMAARPPPEYRASPSAPAADTAACTSIQSEVPFHRRPRTAPAAFLKGSDKVPDTDWWLPPGGLVVSGRASDEKHRSTIFVPAPRRDLGPKAQHRPLPKQKELFRVLSYSAHSLHQENAKLHETVSEQRQRIDELEVRVAQLAKEKNNLCSGQTAPIWVVEALNLQISEVEAANSKLEARLKALVAERDASRNALREERDKLEHERLQAEQERQQLRRDKEALSRALQDAKAQVPTLQGPRQLLNACSWCHVMHARARTHTHRRAHAPTAASMRLSDLISWLISWHLMADLMASHG